MIDDIIIQKEFSGELRGRVMGGVVHRWALGLPRWEPGYLYGVPTLEEPVGPIHFCGDYTNIPCLDTAVSSGLRAAREVKESDGLPQRNPRSN